MSSVITIDVLGGLRSFFDNLWNNIASIINAIIRTVQDFINWIVTSIVTFFRNLINGIINFFMTTIVQPVVGFIGSLINRFISKIDFLIAFWITVPLVFRAPKLLMRWGFRRIIFSILAAPVMGWLAGQVIKALIMPKPITVQLPTPTLPSIPEVVPAPIEFTVLALIGQILITTGGGD